MVEASVLETRTAGTERNEAIAILRQGEEGQERARSESSGRDQVSQTEGETLVPIYIQDVFWGRLKSNPVCHILPLRW